METPFTDSSKMFRDELEASLRDKCNSDPRILSKTEYPEDRLFEKIRLIKHSCSGVIVVADERKFMESGIEKRAGRHSVPIAQEAYTTPWNHIESAMSYLKNPNIYNLSKRASKRRNYRI